MSDDNCDNRLKPSSGKGHFYIDSILHRKKHDPTTSALDDGKFFSLLGCKLIIEQFFFLVLGEIISLV